MSLLPSGLAAAIQKICVARTERFTLHLGRGSVKIEQVFNFFCVKIRLKPGKDLLEHVEKTHPAAKGVRQKEFGKNMTKKATETSEKVTKSDRKSPKTKKSDGPPFADLLLRHPEKPVQFFTGPLLTDLFWPEPIRSPYLPNF